MDKKTQDVMFSSNSDEWETPQDLYDYLDLKYGPFHLDPCATKETAKCPNFLTIEDDAFSDKYFHPEMAWGHSYDSVFINPPYSDIKRWTEAAWKHGNWIHRKAVLLIPGRVCTKYFHDYCMKAYKILFIKGRLKFSNSKNSAPFPSIVVIFGKHTGNAEAFPLVETLDYKEVKKNHQSVVKELEDRNNDIKEQLAQMFKNGRATATAKRMCKMMGFKDLIS